MADKKIIDETHHIASKRGNGQLRREVWIDNKGVVTRYNLAYINHSMTTKDNGRVIGYDNQHGYHHRHHLGEISAVTLTTFEAIEFAFEADWTALRMKK
jgi:Family of unknown function (DUF6516)